MQQSDKKQAPPVACGLLLWAYVPMTLPAHLRRFAVLAATLTPAVVFAHPGHEGGHGDGLTWDFVSEALHRLTSPYHLAPAVIVGMITILAWRKFRAKRHGDARK
ncbi:MAG: hypothetical protein H7067_13780 [Burkholderiales bacterium]|nr:hypothetical protein [Opitutaceae bacterium]